MKISWGCIFFENTQKNFKLNLVLEPKGLLCNFTTLQYMYMLDIADSNIHVYKGCLLHIECIYLPCYLHISQMAQRREHLSSV